MPKGTGRIEVFVTHRDGSPATDTVVVVMGHGRKRTDAYGRVAFEELPAHTFTAAVLEPGFVRTSVNVALGVGESTRVTLRESIGYTASVTVVDQAGAPVPFAEIEVFTGTAVPFVVWDGKTQVLTLHTDADGRCELRELPLQGARVRARFGSRSANGVVPEDGRLELRLNALK
jgi:hypothetical protein